MAAVTDLSDLVNRLTGGNSGTPETIFAFKDNRVDAAAAASTVAGRWTSLWRYNGSPSGASANPGAVAIPDNTTEGALKQTNPGGGRQKWIVGGWGTGGPAAGMLMLYDRLLHVSGLSGTNTGAQTVQSGTPGSRVPPLTRYTDGAGNMVLVEIYTQIGSTATTAVVNYDDQDGNASASPAFAIGGTGLREAQRLIQVPLAAGDTGVTGVADIDLVASTTTAGDFGITIAHPLITFSGPAAGVPGFTSFVQGKLVEVLEDACLAWAWIAQGTALPVMSASVNFVEA